MERLYDEHGAEPSESRAVESDEWKGYHVAVEEEAPRGGERSYLHYLWARLGGVTYQLLGAGADRYRPVLRDTALSLRPLADEDWESIAALRVRVVEARDGENLAQLGERTANRWKPEYTALINGPHRGRDAGGRHARQDRATRGVPAPVTCGRGWWKT